MDADAPSAEHDHPPSSARADVDSRMGRLVARAAHLCAGTAAVITPAATPTGLPQLLASSHPISDAAALVDELLARCPGSHGDTTAGDGELFEASFVLVGPFELGGRRGERIEATTVVCALGDSVPVGPLGLLVIVNPARWPLPLSDHAHLTTVALAIEGELDRQRNAAVPAAALNGLGYHSIFETVDVGFVIFDRDGVIEEANPAFSQQCGLSIDAITGGSITSMFVDPGIQAQMRSNVAAVLGDEWGPPTLERVSLEGELRTLGEPLWVVAGVTAIDASAGRGVMTTHDVTERRHFINRLSRYEQLFRRSNDLIYILERTGRIRYQSPSNATQLGYGPDEPITIDVIHDDDLETAKDIFAKLCRDEGVGEPFALRIKTASGEWKMLECVGANLLDEPSVEGIVVTCRDATERYQLTTELMRRASRDGLTELLNRQAFDHRLDDALARSQAAGSTIAIVYIDLDGFKAINDTLGHAFGDRVLVEMSERLTGAIRGTDLAARIGGDEFVVLLDPTDLEGAMASARRIRHTLLQPLSGRLAALHCGASVGVALSLPGDTAPSLMRRADDAMYRAKRQRLDDVELGGVVTPDVAPSQVDLSGATSTVGRSETAAG